ncbi:nucleotidyltransferase domain-containing protein [Candidatus Woesearchaeota archaeon]|nr:nucleotidyltransferase domain-containing protein [Candidatus Woesearchaeota archaeon]
MVNKLAKVSINELNEAYNKTLIWFYSFPNREIGLNDLSAELGISKSTANKVTKRLQKEGFLQISTIGKVWRIKCNTDHIFNYSRKISYNLTMIYESGVLDDLKKMIVNPISITLFGSYRKGDDTENSDIDLAVEVLDDHDVEIIEQGVFASFGFRKNVPVNLHVFSRNKVDLNLFANIANGIVLEGFLEVRP